VTETEFRELVRDHADAWRIVGESNPALVFDPSRAYYLKDARDCTERLIKAFNEKGSPT
jgi:hypothetical protein